MISNKSEIRAMFIHAFSTNYPDWSLIVPTCVDRGINVIVIESLGNNFARFPSSFIPSWDESIMKLATAIAEAHAHGIELHVSMNVIAESAPTPWSTYAVIDENGNNAACLCPTKTAGRTLIKNIVEELVTNYDIDGFMFDYARYNVRDMCYCPDCRARFEADTGIIPTSWPADVRSGGTYDKQFADWRTKPVNELVRDMRSWMLAIKSHLEFSAATWTWEAGYPTYWREWIGQDSTFWVKEGYLDWVAPMMYFDNPDWLNSSINQLNQYQLGGPEGIIPLVPFIDTCVDAVSTPSNFGERVARLRQLGADGWIIWRYGGPGDGVGSGAPDIRPYLNPISMPPTISLENIQAIGADVSWITNLPATSKIEYNVSPLFTYSFEYDPRVSFSYYKVAYNVGTVIEDLTLRLHQHTYL